LDIFVAIVLALVQGATEFLPISSSAHLILLPRLLGWPDQGLAFDVAVHLGTLLAVIGYFRDEVADITRAWFGAILGREHNRTDARLAWCVLLATLPVVLAGFLFKDFVAAELRSPLVIAVATAVFGVALWLADRRRVAIADEHDINLRAALLIGLAQVLALVPGTSRSGITMTAGLMLGLSRKTAARFSFLMAMPAIAGAAVLETKELLTTAAPVPWLAMLIGLIVAAAAAYVCIRVFLNLIDRVGMFPFMIYRLLLSAYLLFLFV
jgi:undecaprenyl-diphosphatase